jgi:hypothetical protein
MPSHETGEHDIMFRVGVTYLGAGHAVTRALADFGISYHVWRDDS